MTRKFFFNLMVVALLLSISGNAKNVMLKSGTITPDETLLASQLSAVPSQNEIYNDQFIRLVQFKNLLTPAAKATLRAQGIRVMNYIPYNTYYCAFSIHTNLSVLKQFEVTAIIPLTVAMKTDQNLLIGNYPAYAVKKAGMVDLTLRIHSNFKDANLSLDLNQFNASIVHQYPNYNLVIARVPIEQLSSVIQRPYIEYATAILPDGDPEDTKGRSLHRSNTINSEKLNDPKYNGEGVSIALADDGAVGPHIDFTGRMVNYVVGSGGTHGDMTSGIAVGAGNLDPTKAGMANGADIYVYDIGAGPNGYDHIYEAPAHLLTDYTVITSTSYSQGCNTYNAIAATGDQIAHDNPNLCLVFSGGNNNGNDCGYGAGGNWGNITGGFKQGKNVIAAANLDAYEVIDGTSSKGPSEDGRIKPDIAANGRNQMSTDENNTYQVGGGTSAACPSIAGTCAQLYQAFRSLNANADPEGGFIKALLQNTAEDIGNPGPDFTYGYGRINAFRALTTLNNNWYLSDSILANATNTHTIVVPANTQQLKVMLYWIDQDGAPGAAISLVNDLNMTVADPSFQVFNPWVLDHTPNAANLALPATRNIDSRNNMEQVTIDAPTAGTYTVDVEGFSVPSSGQKYYLVWYFITDEIKLTYPVGREGFAPTTPELIRWDAFGTSGNFTLSFSTDSGATYANIATVAGNVRQYEWSVPNNVSGQVFVKVSRGGWEDTNDEPLTIIALPTNISVDFACPNSLQLSWNAVSGATSYEVSRLGVKYMDSLTTVTGTTASLNISSTTDEWFSVRAIANNGNKGRRATAINKQPGLINCSLADDLELLSVINPTPGSFYDCVDLSTVSVMASVKNSGINTINSFTANYKVDGGAIISETFTNSLIQGASVNITFSNAANLSAPGQHQVSVWIDYGPDLNSNNDSIGFITTIYNGSMAPLVESFQNGFPPVGYSIIASGPDFEWASSNVTGSNSAATIAAWFDNFSYNNQGSEDVLQTTLIDLAPLSTPSLSFDVAYAEYPGYADGLRVDVSTDCGVTFMPTTYLKQGSALATVAQTSSDWEPTAANQWRNEVVSLQPYAGQKILLRFVNINGFGNNLYVDNINIANGPTGINETDHLAITIFPNPTIGKFNIISFNNSLNIAEFTIYDATGKLIRSETINLATRGHRAEFDLSGNPKGLYFVSIRSNNDLKTLKISLQ